MLDIGLKGSPIAVFAGAMDYGQGTEFVSGAGLERDAAFFRCLFEYAERKSALARASDLMNEATRADLPHLKAQSIFLDTEPTTDDGLAGWIMAQSMGAPGREVAVPAECVLLATARANVSDSNGLAAHASSAGAELAGLIELVERDAVAIWWYNRLRRPFLPWPETAGRLDALGLWLKERQRLTYLLDLTADIPLPVVAAISMTPEGKTIAYGFGAAPSPALAVEKAVLEMARAELSSHFHTALAARDREGSRFGAWSAQSRIEDLPHLVPDPDAEPAQHWPEKRLDRQGLLAALASVGLDAYAVDLTRADIGVPVARVIVPGLRPWWPRFAKGRLYDVPLRMGWRRRRLARRHMNDVPILI
ncbi:ribosomal protein S12 methylthiotransferase accessory factor [Arboricoccus pini]|uniref:Ribosomal protein S12 methylthiotransferase accessory factor n=2 Tax=Arboricoccus pini TaxID=1963835 RepID=A0A212RN77_9PROT|nr:ribosomal protein S12 methylthiotransferase accessory factor [Arboricoccus pini]